MSSSPAAAKRLDNAVKEIDKNVTGVHGDADNLADLDRLFEMVKKGKGRIDILFASAGVGELANCSALLLRKVLMIHSMSMFAGPCLPCKRLCRL